MLCCIKFNLTHLINVLSMACCVTSLINVFMLMFKILIYLINCVVLVFTRITINTFYLHDTIKTCEDELKDLHLSLF